MAWGRGASAGIASRGRKSAETRGGGATTANPGRFRATALVLGRFPATSFDLGRDGPGHAAAAGTAEET